MQIYTEKIEQMNNTNESRIEKLNAMLESNPNDCFLRHALGLELQKEGKPAEAIEAFKQVLNVDENYVGTYYHLALAISKENEDEAKPIFEKGMEVARAQNDKHAENELRMVYEEIYEEW